MGAAAVRRTSATIPRDASAAASASATAQTPGPCVPRANPAAPQAAPATPTARAMRNAMARPGPDRARPMATAAVRAKMTQRTAIVGTDGLPFQASKTPGRSRDHDRSRAWLRCRLDGAVVEPLQPEDRLDPDRGPHDDFSVPAECCPPTSSQPTFQPGLLVGTMTMSRAWIAGHRPQFGWQETRT